MIAIRERMSDRAVALGRACDGAAGVHLDVGAGLIGPVARGERSARFELSSGRAEVWLCSPSLMPGERDAGSLDTRRLGLAVQRLILSDGNVRIEAWHDYPDFADGFHDDEASHRWTDGPARIPLSLLSLFPGAVTVEVHLARPAAVTRAAA